MLTNGKRGFNRALGQRRNRRGMPVVPARRGTLVVPTDVGWMIQRGAPDLTSRSLQEEIRRGVLVTPAELEWIIKRNATDPTSGSLQPMDATSGSRQAWRISGLRLKFRATFVTLSAQPDRLGVFRNGYAG